METTRTHDRSTAYVQDGGTDARGICFVHGSGCTHAVWDQQRSIGDYPTVSLDLSGHGDSADVEALPGFSTLSAYADDVLSVASATDARVLVGHSLGAAVAMHIGLDRAFEPDALVLVGTGARLGVLQDLLDWLDGDFERAVAFLQGPDRFFHDPDHPATDRTAAMLRETGQAVTRRDFRTAHQWDVTDRLSALEVPTLVVCGENDRLTPPWYHDHLAEALPAAELVVVPEAAHMVMLERPTEFGAALTQFLADLPDQ